MILCLGDESDQQLQHVVTTLHDLQEETLILNTANLGDQLKLQWQPLKNAFTLVVDNEYVDIDEAGAFWWQRFSVPPAANPVTGKNQISALSPLFYHQPERWYNPLSAIRFHQAKPVQLQTASALGATIPETLISNDATALKHFAEQFQDVIIKPVSGGAHTTLLRQHGVYISEHLHQQDTGTVTLQARIDGLDVRTYVIGDEVFSGVIYSDKPDYRTDECAEAQATDIPEDIRSLARTICAAFGMKWCAIDWRCNSKGEFIFLEANPCPYFLKFEHETQHPLTETLCRALITTAEH